MADVEEIPFSLSRLNTQELGELARELRLPDGGTRRELEWTLIEFFERNVAPEDVFDLVYGEGDVSFGSLIMEGEERDEDEDERYMEGIETSRSVSPRTDDTLIVEDLPEMMDSPTLSTLSGSLTKNPISRNHHPRCHCRRRRRHRRIMHHTSMSMLRRNSAQFSLTLTPSSSTQVPRQGQNQYSITPYYQKVSAFV